MTFRTILFASLFIVALSGAVFIVHTHPDQKPKQSANELLGSEVSATSTKTVPATSANYSQKNFSKHLSLTSANIVWFTNYYRTEKGLKPLAINTKLTRSSGSKATDMLDNQYFEHIRPGPDKVGFDKFIDDEHYSFVKIGENLAMGDFSTSYEVVKAWMNSPAHKRNILDPQYSEIGVSISYGAMNGQEVGIMVQHFGNPRKNCPSLDSTLKEEISSLRQKVSLVQQEISLKQTSLSSHESSITEYNQLVENYNILVKQIGDLVDNYNKQVKAIDLCIKR